MKKKNKKKKNLSRKWIIFILILIALAYYIYAKDKCSESIYNRYFTGEDLLNTVQVHEDYILITVWTGFTAEKAEDGTYTKEPILNETFKIGLGEEFIYSPDGVCRITYKYKGYEKEEAFIYFRKVCKDLVKASCTAKIKK